MTDILISDPFFSRAEALCELLIGRRVSVAMGEAEGCHTLIVSAAEAAKADQTKAIVDRARKLGAKMIVVVDTTAAEWSEHEELGGRLLRVGLPARDLLATRDAHLMNLADRIAQPFGTMVAADPATGKLIDMASRVARFDVSVFINGPTGSGKEVLSRLIHERSSRKDKPFVAINCAAIPENMLEAILFGHEKGAFTGAATQNKGLVRAADGGTLLLDEISEMPLGLQAKLLRVIQERKVTPLGSHTETPVDIRILATSNRNMPVEIARGTFREDLFYRLNVFPLSTLELGARPSDIPVLAQAMLRRHCPQGQQVPVLSPEACDVLAAYSWPGNVRELENVMQRALVLADTAEISPAHIMLGTDDFVLPEQNAA